jgi:hypothetical protein
MKCQIFVDILLLIGVVYLFSCSNGNRTTYNDSNTTHASYNINHYLDTIEGHIILTTVCDANNASGVVSVSTLELNN